MNQHSLFDSDDELAGGEESWDIEDDEPESEEEDVYEGLFGLVAHDIPIIHQLIGCVRKIIARPDVTPEQIHSLAKLLFALERLPKPVPALDINLAVGRCYENGESSYFELVLSDQVFRLEQQSYIRLDPSAGGDSVAATIFEAEVGGFRSLEDVGGLLGWLDDFESACGEMDRQIDVTDITEAAVDWSIAPDPDLWDRLDFNPDSIWL